MTMPTDEWLAQFQWRFEPRDVDSDRLVVVRNLTPFALDRYFQRGELGGTDEENERAYLAGDQLRTDWEIAGLTLLARAKMEPGFDGGVESFSNSRLAARERIKQAMTALGPTRDVVVDVCVFGAPAKKQIEVLRVGLSALADHWGLA
jgi:hypothetical protein